MIGTSWCSACRAYLGTARAWLKLSGERQGSVESVSFLGEALRQHLSLVDHQPLETAAAASGSAWPSVAPRGFVWLANQSASSPKFSQVSPSAGEWHVSGAPLALAGVGRRWLASRARLFSTNDRSKAIPAIAVQHSESGPPKHSPCRGNENLNWLPLSSRGVAAVMASTDCICIADPGGTRQLYYWTSESVPSNTSSVANPHPGVITTDFCVHLWIFNILCQCSRRIRP